jgi:hypothetical protein
MQRCLQLYQPHRGSATSFNSEYQFSAAFLVHINLCMMSREADFDFKNKLKWGKSGRKPIRRLAVV